MHALVLLQAAAVDTVAVVKVVNDILTAVGDGWLPQGFRDWLSALVLGVPILAMVFSFEWVTVAIGRLLPMLTAAVGPFFNRIKPFLLPLLAALFAGGVFHDPTVGLGAGVGWGILNSLLKAFGKPTAAGLIKAKAVALVAASLLALTLATPSMAEEKEHYGVLSLERFSFSPGVGYRWERSLSDEKVPYWDVKLGYTLPPWSFIKLDARLGHNLGPIYTGAPFVDARLGLVF